MVRENELELSRAGNHLDFIRDVSIGNANRCKQEGNQYAAEIFMRLSREVASQIDSPPFIRFNRAVDEAVTAVMNSKLEPNPVALRVQEYYARIINHEIEPSAAEYLDAHTAIYATALGALPA